MQSLSNFVQFHTRMHEATVSSVAKEASLQPDNSKPSECKEENGPTPFVSLDDEILKHQIVSPQKIASVLEAVSDDQWKSTPLSQQQTVLRCGICQQELIDALPVRF